MCHWVGQCSVVVCESVFVSGYIGVVHPGSGLGCVCVRVCVYVSVFGGEGCSGVCLCGSWRSLGCVNG